MCKFYPFSSGWVLFYRIHVIDVNTKVEQEELEELRGQGCVNLPNFIARKFQYNKGCVTL
jgi:hypothetical protein